MDIMCARRRTQRSINKSITINRKERYFARYLVFIILYRLYRSLVIHSNPICLIQTARLDIPVLILLFSELNSVIVYGVPDPPTPVLNAAARLTSSSSPIDHITDALVCLHWQRDPERFQFKIAVLAYKAFLARTRATIPWTTQSRR